MKEPKFKVGDVIKNLYAGHTRVIEKIDEKNYYWKWTNGQIVSFSHANAERRYKKISKLEKALR